MASNRTPKVWPDCFVFSIEPIFSASPEDKSQERKVFVLHL
jgi:hypothetical protein